MAEIKQSDAQHVSVTKPGLITCQDEQVQYLVEFLTWIQNTHGMTLCHPFQPRYDWYMPALANKSKLASQFIGEQLSADLEALQWKRPI